MGIAPKCKKANEGPKKEVTILNIKFRTGCKHNYKCGEIKYRENKVQGSTEFEFIGGVVGTLNIE